MKKPIEYKMVEMYGQMVRVAIYKPSNKKCGLGLSKARFNKSQFPALWAAKERDL